MSNSKKHRQKPQTTGRFTDEKEAHLWQALDLGFASRFWARIRSEAIIQTVEHVEPPQWVSVKIMDSNDSKERTLTRATERLAAARNVPHRYIVVRTKSSIDDSRIDSRFFFHGLDASDIATRMPSWSDIKPVVIDSVKLSEELKELFTIELHPDKKGIKRWGTSGALKNELTLHRMEYLIELARKQKDLELVEGLPHYASFEDRLARCITHDRPLTYKLKTKQIFLILAQSEKSGMITRAETIKVLLEILSRKLWKREYTYLGLPKAGADLDRQKKEYLVLEQKLSALAIRLKKLEPGEIDWDTIEVPEPREEYLE